MSLLVKLLSLIFWNVVGMLIYKLLNEVKAETALQPEEQRELQRLSDEASRRAMNLARIEDMSGRPRAEEQALSRALHRRPL